MSLSQKCIRIALGLSVMAGGVRWCCAREERQSLTFEYPFAQTEFEYAYKTCAQMWFDVQTFSQGQPDDGMSIIDGLIYKFCNLHSILDKIVGQKEHKSIICGDITYLDNMLNGIQARINQQLARGDEVSCINVLSQRAKNRLRLLFDGCIAL